jgi:hypothetical protein
MKSPIAIATAELFGQIQQVITTLDDRTYSQPVSAIGNASIGQHLRHLTGFYDCLMLATTELNYDQRARSTTLEFDRLAMISKLEELSAKLHELNPDATICIHCESGYKELLPASGASTVGRELIYAYEHAIHHLAFVRIAVEQAFSEVSLPPDFGFAPSTLRYRNTVQR